MHPLLDYPFDAATVLKKRRSIRRELLADGTARQTRRIAILGGSTTHDIRELLELFLLDQGIAPVFYESEFGQFWQDAMFGEELAAFEPELIYIHTSSRNISAWPEPAMDAAAVEALLETQYGQFEVMWDTLREKYRCPIIQNNFEKPYYRLLGSWDAWDVRGRVSFTARLNEKFCQYARTHSAFYLHDIDYLAADYGLSRWADPLYWHMYKYCMAMDAMPAFAWSLSNLIKSLYGKNKKALVLDLDNTLWGGVVGDDGVEGIEIGHETSMGQVYSEFQQYLKELKGLGILLAVNSKNDLENAMAGLEHPEGTLRPDDFVAIRANWEPKDQNFREIAAELNLLPESMVFVDDNPAERAIVTGQIPGVHAPAIDAPERYVTILDRAGYFEATEVSRDDLHRSDMYRANAQRAALQQRFTDYGDYLRSLDMRAEIRDFTPVYLARITQLTNKSNQFNLTTRRYTESEMQAVSQDPARLRLYGKLTDKFGDNGVVTVVIGRQEGTVLHIELWLMSCRVLKRNMEHAMLDEVVRRAKSRGVEIIRGYYYKTAKNSMVRDFWPGFGFTLAEQHGDDTVWELPLEGYTPKNHVIRVNESDAQQAGNRKEPSV